MLTRDNLNLPAVDWTVLGPATKMSGDLYQFTDHVLPTEAQRFYRLQGQVPR
jgi:hypothetical protein